MAAISQLGAWFAHGVQTLRMLVRLVRHESTPWYAKAILGLAVFYLMSPIQLIPNVIPVIGQLDDALVLVAAVWIAKRLVDPRILVECGGTV